MKEDGQDLYEYLSDPEVVKYEPYEPFTKEAAEEEAVRRAEMPCFYAVVLKENNKLIGNIYLEKGEFDTWEIGYVFNRRFQGKGYATEAASALVNKAFKEWGARRLVAMCTPLNERSWKLMERLGMRREGTLLQNIYFKTDEMNRPIWLDTYEYGLLKEEWIGNQLIACERKYLEAFSTVKEEDKIAYFEDVALKDMYAHNFSFIKKSCSIDDVIEHIKDQAHERETKGFLQLVFEDGRTEEEIEMIRKYSPCKMEVERLGRYLLSDNRKMKDWKEVNGCNVIVQKTQVEVEDAIKLDVAVDGDHLSHDFCTRRAKRFGEVSIENEKCYNHLIYIGDECIGNCMLFVDEGIAKIENFVIASEQRGKGYGLTLFKAVCQKALEVGAKRIFLDADEDDTPKELYKRLGFEKVGMHYELLWADWMK